MKVTVELKNCGDCRHLGHSGSFTPGGASAICQGPNAIKIVGKFKKIPCPPNYTKHLNKTSKSSSKQHMQAMNFIHYKHRIVDINDSIPGWCPMKQGEKY